MERYIQAIIRFRVAILILSALITAGLAAALPRLYADDDVMQFLPADDPDIALFRRVNERFGGLDVAIVGLESDDLFEPGRLAQIRKLTRIVQEIDGVYDVLSFTEVPDPRPSPFGLVVEPLVDQVPEDRADLAALKKKVLANKNAVGNLISEDGKAAMMLCFLGGKRPPIHVAADIKAAALDRWTGGQIYFGGAPFIRLHVAGGTKEDMIRLTPVVAVVVVLVTFLLFKRPVGAALALGAVVVSLVWLMGLLALRGKGITVVGSSLPTLLIAIGGAYGIHILAAYFNGASPTVRERIVEAFKEVGAPVVASALTTCAGFLSFLAMDVAPMREFGASAALGVALTGLVVVTAIPAVLSFGKKLPGPMGTRYLSEPLGKVAGWAEKHEVKAIGVALVFAVFGLIGILRIAPDATLKSFFTKGSEPDRANAFLTRHFGGSVYLQIYFEGDMRSPFVLAQLRKVVEFADGMEEVVQVSSIINPLVMMSSAMGGRADLPVNRERTRSLYPFLEGSAAIDQMVSKDKDASLVQIRLKEIDADQANRAVEKLRSFIRTEIPKAIKAVALDRLSAREREHLTAQVHLAVAERVARLVKIDGGQSPGPEQIQALATLISSRARQVLTSGPDLTKAVSEVVAEHIGSEASPLEEPVESAEPGAKTEWEERAKRAIQALAPLSNRLLDPGRVQAALNRALPLTAKQDPEGLRLASSAVANGINMALASVRAGRLVTPVLSAVGVEHPSKELTERVTWALTDVDAPVFGFPDDTGDASAILAKVSGQPVINTAFCQSTIRNQLRSLAVALVVLILVLSITLRSVVIGIKALAPTVVMLCLSVGVMGAAAIPLDLTTTMIAAIALGIGVDYAIHFLWRHRRRGESLARTAAHVGPSIASNAVQVASGFLVLTLSDQVPMRRFGLLVAMTMMLSAVATFVLLPALRTHSRPRASGRTPDDAQPAPVP